LCRETNSQNFQKKRLPVGECLIVSAPRHPTGCKPRRRENAGREKVEENSKFPLTAELEPLRFPSRCKAGLLPTQQNWFFQLLGLQIELNLVPTMKVAPGRPCPDPGRRRPDLRKRKI
jgi:hypothetical protein